MCLLNCVYFRQEIEDLISTSCTEQAGKFPFWMLWSDGAANIPRSHHCGLAFPLACRGGLGDAGGPEHLLRAQKEPLFPDAGQCPGHFTRPCVVTTSFGTPGEQATWLVQKNGKTNAEKEVHMMQSSI